MDHRAVRIDCKGIRLIHVVFVVRVVSGDAQLAAVGQIVDEYLFVGAGVCAAVELDFGRHMAGRIVRHHFSDRGKQGSTEHTLTADEEEVERAGYVVAADLYGRGIMGYDAE